VVVAVSGAGAVDVGWDAGREEALCALNWLERKSGNVAGGWEHISQPRPGAGCDAGASARTESDDGTSDISELE